MVALADFSAAVRVETFLSLMLAYGDPLGFQEDGEGGGCDLFNLRKDIPGHPKGSTVSRQTLETAIRVLHPTVAKYGKITVAEMDPPESSA